MARGLQALFYNALNVPMRVLLRSPVHGIASSNLCVLMYAGRRSGRRFETPLSYVRDGGRVLLLTSRDTRWWTNFVPAANDPAWSPVPVEVLAAGEILRGRAQTIQQDRERLRAGVRHFLTALPRDAMVYGIGLDAERRPKETEIGRELERLVMVEVALEA
jgi:F420H(2)-dependent quinone reductase